MLTRRAILQKCPALGSLTVASSFSAEAMFAVFQEHEKQLRKPTPPNSIGPFYKRLAPRSDMLRAPGDPGLPLSVSGHVFDTRGDVLSNATIETLASQPLRLLRHRRLSLSGKPTPRQLRELQV
jgi:hypothetical protein